MHESNGLRFDIIITSRQLKVKEQHSGVQEISHSYHAANWGFCRLALFFLTAGFTQKIEINKPFVENRHCGYLVFKVCCNQRFYWFSSLMYF